MAAAQDPAAVSSEQSGADMRNVTAPFTLTTAGTLSSASRTCGSTPGSNDALTLQLRSGATLACRTKSDRSADAPSEDPGRGRSGRRRDQDRFAGPEQRAERARGNSRSACSRSSRRLNYHPSLSARSLAGRRSYLIGLVYENPSANYIVDVQHGAMSRCREGRFQLLMHQVTGRGEELERDVIGPGRSDASRRPGRDGTAERIART